MSVTTYSVQKLFFAFFLSLVLGRSYAASCLENRTFDKNLPPFIGKEDQVGKLTYAIKCDTVYVRKGVTTIIYPGTMLYFLRPTLNSVIKVEGILLIKGSKNSFVSLSGSLDSSRYGVEAGNRQWGGIEVSKGGRLEVEYAGFMNAPTPITTFSRDVKILNSWFKGSTGVTLPDGTFVKMESKWQAINEMDMAKGDFEVNSTERPADAISEKEKQALLVGTSGPGFWTWKKIATGAVALAVVGGVTNYYLTPQANKTKIPSVPTEEKPKLNIDGIQLNFPSEGTR